MTFSKTQLLAIFGALILGYMMFRSRYAVMTWDELITEHENLVSALKTANTPELKAELEEQQTELERYLQHHV